MEGARGKEVMVEFERNAEKGVEQAVVILTSVAHALNRGVFRSSKCTADCHEYRK